jgi:hypothetical protein
MRMPVAAQRASMSLGWATGFEEGIDFAAAIVNPSARRAALAFRA